MQAKHLLVLLFPLTSFADVNMRDASYIHHLNEWAHPIFKKSYNSRSLFQGTFGFGWCAEFEKTLLPKDGTRYHCGQTTQVRAQAKKIDWIVLNTDGSTEIYNTQGQLKAFKFPKHAPAFIEYRNDHKIESIKVQSQKFVFAYDVLSGALKEIRNAKQFARYKYHHSNLVQVQTDQRYPIQFEYDSFHNLIKLQYDSQKWEKITYNRQSDEIQSIQASNGCHEKYHFQKTSKFELKSSIVKSCPSSLPQKKTFSFLAKRTPQGSFQLNQVKIAGDTNELPVLP